MLQRLLGRPQRCIRAALRQKRGMCAVLNDMAALEHVNFIRRGDVRKPVRDEQHRLVSGERVDLGHDVVFALNVDVGGRFVEDADGLSCSSARASAKRWR